MSMIISSVPCESHKLSCLCLLDFSVTFDTVDILITRLSFWFGIHGSVLNWFNSHLSPRSICVNCANSFSSEHISSSGVLHGSVLGPLFFIIYTTPPVFKAPPLRRSQLFSYSILVTCYSSIAHLYTGITGSHIHLLTLNSSMTEFFY